MYAEKIKMFLRNEERLAATLIALYNVVWGQCSIKMQDRLLAEEKFAKIKKTDDVVGLLKLIKAISHQFGASRTYEEHLDEATFKMMTYHQGEHDTVAEHIRNIRNLHKVIEH